MSSTINMTVFVPLSGRAFCLHRLMDFLEHQEIDKSRCLLYLLDTSSNDTEEGVLFSQKVADWVAVSLVPLYASVQHVGRSFSQTPGLADKPRDKYVFAQVNRAMVAIYQYAQRVVEGDHIFIVEDDIIPPLDAFKRLSASLTADTFSVSGAYPIRDSKAWTAWRDLETRASITPGQGIEAVKATGLGCLVMRAAEFRDAELQWTPQDQGRKDWPWGYDMEFFSRAPAGREVLIDWDVRCEHLNSK